MTRGSSRVGNRIAVTAASTIVVVCLALYFLSANVVHLDSVASEGPEVGMDDVSVEAPAQELLDRGDNERVLIGSKRERPDTGDMVVVATYEDGGRAAGYSLRVEAGNGRGWSCVTNARGVALLEGLPPGVVVVSTLRQAFGGHRATIAVGKVTEMEITVPMGLELRGRVTTAEGTAAPGATLLWVVDGTGRERAVPCGKTDETGRFHLSDVPHRSYVGARLMGHETSLYKRVVDTESDMALVLERPGGAIVGRVVGPEGEGVRGARITVLEGQWGGRRFVSRLLLDNQRAIKEIVQATETDEDGRFAIEGVGVGERIVLAEDAAKGAATMRVVVAREERAEVVLSLELAGTVEIQVIDSNGNGVRGQKVSLAVPGARTYTGYTRKDGRYPFSGIMAGVAKLSFMYAGKRIAREIRVVGGEKTETIVRVKGGVELKGIVVDETGAPHWGMRIEAVFEGDENRSPWRRSGSTDENGGFLIRHVPRTGRLQLLVSRDRSYVGMRDGVDPTAGFVTLVVERSAANIGTCIIKGRVDVPAGKDVTKVRLQFIGRKRARGSLRLTPSLSGMFEIEVVQDSYDIVMAAPGLACQWLGPFRAEGVTVLDIGALDAKHGGSITFSVSGSAPEEVTGVEVFDIRGRRVGRALSGESRTGQTTPLPEGVYYVRGFGRCVTDMVRCTVEENQRTSVKLTARKGVPVQIKGRLRQKGGGMQRVRVAVREKGREIAFWNRISDWNGGWKVAGVLPLGAYDVEWEGETTGGGKGRISVTKDSGVFELPGERSNKR